jgi:uncharacterized DUF497 family protein
MQIQDTAGFDWDSGNANKCQKHGVSFSEIEYAFHQTMNFFPDLAHSQNEPRYLAIGNTKEGRSLFVSFTFKHRESETDIRPVSTRYMHKKEVEYYEKTITNP